MREGVRAPKVLSQTSVAPAERAWEWNEGPVRKKIVCPREARYEVIWRGPCMWPEAGKAHIIIRGVEAVVELGMVMVLVIVVDGVVW